MCIRPIEADVATVNDQVGPPFMHLPDEYFPVVLEVGVGRAQMGVRDLDDSEGVHDRWADLGFGAIEARPDSNTAAVCAAQVPHNRHRLTFPYRNFTLLNATATSSPVGLRREEPGYAKRGSAAHGGPGSACWWPHPAAGLTGNLKRPEMKPEDDRWP